MNIQPAAAPRNIAYAEKLAQTYAHQPEAYAQAKATVDRVTISPAAQAMNDSIAQAVYRDDPPGLLANGELPPIPAWTMNYEESLSRAQDGLQEAMRQLGIPANTPFTIKGGNADGTLTVEGDFPQKAELEALVNENMALRNALVCADNAAHFSRMAAAHEQVLGAVNANPENADRYYSWLIDVSQRISHMGFELNFADGKLDGKLIDGAGQRIGILENLEKLPA